MTHYASFVMPSRKWKKSTPYIFLLDFFPKEVNCNLLLGLRRKGLILYLPMDTVSIAKWWNTNSHLYSNEKEKRLNHSDYLYMLESVKEKK